MESFSTPTKPGYATPDGQDTTPVRVSSRKKTLRTLTSLTPHKRFLFQESLSQSTRLKRILSEYKSITLIENRGDSQPITTTELYNRKNRISLTYDLKSSPSRSLSRSLTPRKSYHRSRHYRRQRKQYLNKKRRAQTPTPLSSFQRAKMYHSTVTRVVNKEQNFSFLYKKNRIRQRIRKSKKLIKANWEKELRRTPLKGMQDSERMNTPEKFGTRKKEPRRRSLVNLRHLGKNAEKIMRRSRKRGKRRKVKTEKWVSPFEQKRREIARERKKRDEMADRDRKLDHSPSRRARNHRLKKTKVKKMQDLDILDLEEGDVEKEETEHTEEVGIQFIKNIIAEDEKKVLDKNEDVDEAGKVESEKEESENNEGV